MTTFRLKDISTNNDSITKVKETPIIETGIKATNEDENKKNGIKEIILKGPLGHAYTEALNLLLNKQTNASGEIRQESFQEAMQAQIYLDEEQEGDDVVPDSAKGFVYVYDGKKMGLNDVSNMFEDLAGSKQTHPDVGHISGTVENAEHLLKDAAKSRSLETMTLALEAIGIPLFFSRKATMNSLISFITKGK